MAHERKKNGQRKDKKMQNMREAVADRKANPGPEKPTRDEKDIITYKSGSQGDRNQDPSAFKGGKGPTNKR
jgi:hypothetical protein